MLNLDDTPQGRLARKLEFAITLAEENGWTSKSAVATACGRSRQAVNGWINSGRIAKPHLGVIAALTHAPIEHFIKDDDVVDWRERVLSPSHNTQSRYDQSDYDSRETERCREEHRPYAVSHNVGDVHELPILTYRDIMDGTYRNLPEIAQSRPKIQTIRRKLGAGCFILPVRDDSMDGGDRPLARGLLAVIDPDAQPVHESIVLIYEPGGEPLLRMFWKEGAAIYSRATAGGLPPRPLDPAHVIGVAVHAMLDLAPRT